MTILDFNDILPYGKGGTSVHGTATAERQRLALAQKIISALQRDERIVVIGWRDSNHNRETRLLARTGLVQFVLDSPGHFGSNTGLVISTKFTSHSMFDQVRKWSDIHPVVLSNGEIKRLLFGCKDEFLKTEARIIREKSKVAMEDLTLPVVVHFVATGTSKQQPPTLTQGVSMETSIPEDRKEEVKDYTKFVELFLNQASITGGMVGKEAVGKIRRACGLDNVTNAELVKRGYLVAVVSDGCKNAGRYRAGTMMSGQSTVETKALECKDPLIKARILIGTEAMVMDEIRTIETRLEELELELARIKEAKQLIERIENMFK